jgi:hypothetical protein
VRSSGHEWLLRFAYQPTRSVSLLIQAREEKKVRNVAGENDPLYFTAAGIKRNYLLNCQYTILPQLKLRTRFQMSTFSISNQSSEGMAVIQDIQYSIGKIELTGRYALFDTDTYDNRQYVYEDDVWLVYSLPAYDGVGIRHYILVQYKITPQISVWMKYARTRYTDRQEIGSGPDTIPGEIKDDIKLQLRVQF